MRLPDSLHARLLLSHLAVGLISILLILVFAGGAIFTAAREEVKHSLQDLAFVASNGLERPMREFLAGERDLELLQLTTSRLLMAHPQIRYTIYWPDGMPLLDSSSVLPSPADNSTASDVLRALEGDTGESQDIHADSQGEQIVHVSVRIQRENDLYGVLRLGLPLKPALDSARRSLGLLALMGLLVTTGIAMFGWLLANNLARPIQSLTHTAERLSHGDLSARVKPTGTQEFQRLADAFNQMALRLQAHVDQLRSFVANASHELRTPLTAVKLRVEALRNGALDERVVSEQFLAEIEGEVDRLICMVNDLLDLSRMEAGLVASQRAPVNLGVIATEVCETFNIRASKSGVDLSLNLEPNLPFIVGNEDQLRRVLYNFVDNAIKYTPRGGRVDLFLQSGDRGRSVRLAIQDTGLGIPREHLPHIFERFYRAEATRPRYGTSKGSGLGLAIARSIIENHGGKLGVTSELNKGTTFWAEFPAQA